MKFRKSLIGIAIIGLVAGAATVLAGPGPQRALGPCDGHGPAADGRPGPPGPRGEHAMGMEGPLGPPGPLGMAGRALRRLDLSEDQRAKLDALVDEARPDLEALRHRMRAMESAFRAGSAPSSFDEAAIRAHVARRGEIEADLAVRTAKLCADAVALLSADQREQLAAMKAGQADCRERRRHGTRW